MKETPATNSETMVVDKDGWQSGLTAVEGQLAQTIEALMTYRTKHGNEIPGELGATLQSLADSYESATKQFKNFNSSTNEDVHTQQQKVNK